MKRLLRLTALALGLTLLLSACGHKNTEPERKDAATQTVPVEGITGLTLCDGESPLWLSPGLRKDETTTWLRFHCGCPIVEEADKAAFALVADASELPPLSVDGGEPQPEQPSAAAQAPDDQAADPAAVQTPDDQAAAPDAATGDSAPDAPAWQSATTTSRLSRWVSTLPSSD